jgi:F0F1-type ATP synthase membrane subunit b/b'
MTTADNAKMFDSLEKRIERILERFRAATEENARLKARLAEREAEIEKSRLDLAAARKSAKKEEELSAELVRHEAENEKVRERLTKLIETLETIDGTKG